MNLNRFVEYVYDFYGPEGIYPMNVNRADILSAAERIMSDDRFTFIGDSLDRERVRDVLVDVKSFGRPRFV